MIAFDNEFPLPPEKRRIPSAALRARRPPPAKNRPPSVSGRVRRNAPPVSKQGNGPVRVRPIGRLLRPSGRNRLFLLLIGVLDLFLDVVHPLLEAADALA